MRGHITIPRRIHIRKDSVWRDPSSLYPITHFRELLDNPAQGAFIMPADGRLCLTTVPGASDGWLGARLTGPTERTVTVPPMNPGGRHLIGWVEYGICLTLDGATAPRCATDQQPRSDRVGMTEDFAQPGGALETRAVSQRSHGSEAASAIMLA